ncbi:hypothetical protein VNI00_012579 [Paramarasmius palmivorus]|uniref:Uncharacterized protein n=1 Tax=Paramarasmius palmivorus TaxID=297713 RepID=A0AAW0C4Q1_9AGAR
MNHPKPRHNINPHNHIIPQTEDRQPNENINKRAQEAPPSILTVGSRGNGRRGRGSEHKGRGSRRGAKFGPNGARINTGDSSQRLGSRARGTGREQTSREHQSPNNTSWESSSSSFGASRPPGNSAGSRTSHGQFGTRDNGWAGRRDGRHDHTHTDSQDGAKIHEGDKPALAAHGYLPGKDRHDLHESAQTAVGSNSPIRPNSPHRMPPPRQFDEPHSHVSTHKRLHFHPRKPQRQHDDASHEECSPSPLPLEYDIQYPELEDDADLAVERASSPSSDYTGPVGSPENVSLPSPSVLRSKPLPDSSSVRVSRYKDIGVQWINPASPNFDRNIEESQPSDASLIEERLNRASPMTENVGVQWQRTVNVVIPLKRTINSALVTMSETHHDTGQRSPKRRKLVSNCGANSSPAVTVKAECRSPSVELREIQAPSNPLVKVERSPSPNRLEPVRNQITEGSQWYHPMPTECHKINPNWAKNRRKWFEKESAILLRKGLKLERHFFRDDGMVIDWTSSTPRWTDSLDPTSPPATKTTNHDDREVIDLTLDVDEPTRSAHPTRTKIPKPLLPHTPNPTVQPNLQPRAIHTPQQQLPVTFTVPLQPQPLLRELVMSQSTPQEDHDYVPAALDKKWPKQSSKRSLPESATLPRPASTKQSSSEASFASSLDAGPSTLAFSGNDIPFSARHLDITDSASTQQPIEVLGSHGSDKPTAPRTSVTDRASLSAQNHGQHQGSKKPALETPLPGWAILASLPPSPRAKAWKPPVRSLFPLSSVTSDDKEEDELDEDSEDEEQRTVLAHICGPVRGHLSVGKRA